MCIPLSPQRIIDELRPYVWIKADRPGIQLLARAILPHTLDPQTHQPVALFITGSSYKAVGTWEQLSISNLPLLLSRQLWPLQAKMGPVVDVREAYVDQVLLNIYGGVGQTTVEIDDLAMDGVVPFNHATSPQPVSSANEMTSARPLIQQVSAIGAPVGGDASFATQTQPNGNSPRPIAFSGSTLMVDGHPMLPRIIEYQGEPLAFLKDLGFNVVHVKTPLTPALLEEARQTGIRLIAAPPASATSDAPATTIPSANSATADIDPQYAPVLAWHLGAAPSADALPAITVQARQLRQSDRQLGRPIICEASENLRAFSRQVDVLSLSRSVAGTSLELNEYGTWLTQRMQLARPATPFWAVIDTTPPRSLTEQIAVLTGRVDPAPTIDVDVLRLEVYRALMAGVRGIEFASGSRLDAADKSTQLRADSLAILNAELELMEPWVAAGGFAGTVTANDPAISGAVLNVSSGRLAIVARSPLGSQYVAAPSSGGTELPLLPGAPRRRRKRSDKADGGAALKGSKPLSRGGGGGDPLDLSKQSTGAPPPGKNTFPSDAPAGPVNLIIPAVPEATYSFEVTPVDVHPIRRNPVAGGSAMALDDFPLTAAVLFSSDPIVIESIRQRASQLAPRVAAIQRRISAAMLDDVAAVSARMPSRAELPPVTSTLSQAQADIARADQLLATGDWTHAFIASRSAARTLGRWKREAWQRTVKPLPAVVTSPLAVAFDTLPEQMQLVAATAAPPSSENLLAGGGFEDLSAMLAAGWRHFEHPQSEVQTSVELSPVAPYADHFSLLMHVASTLSAKKRPATD